MAGSGETLVLEPSETNGDVVHAAAQLGDVRVNLAFGVAEDTLLGIMIIRSPGEPDVHTLEFGCLKHLLEHRECPDRAASSLDNCPRLSLERVRNDVVRKVPHRAPAPLHDSRSQESDRKPAI